MKLGILDWGIGGVGLLQKVREKSDVDVVYFSDSGYEPYGKVPTDELRLRVNKVIGFLKNEGCEWIAVACNAASTVIKNDKSIIGIIEPAIDSVKEKGIKKLGVVGGKRTIESDLYKNALETFGCTVQQEIAQVLSARIEAGDLNSIELENDIERIFSPLKTERYILLACTHYPVIAAKINDFLPEVELIDPIDKMAEMVLGKIIGINGSEKIEWMTSGDSTEMQRVIKLIYGLETFKIEKTNL